MKDWRGTEIDIGDTITYAVKESCNVDINEAIVVAYGVKPRYSWSDNSDMIPYIKADWLRSNGGEWAEKCRVIKRVTLHTFENITVIRKFNEGERS